MANGTGTAVSDYTVLVFSVDAARWTPHSRHIRADRPDHRGAFNIQGLPPGEYVAAAAEFVEEGQWFDPSYLASLRPRAKTITITPDTPVGLQLRISGEVQ